MLRVRLCGDVEVEAGGRALPSSLLAGRQGRLVFAYLVCHRHRPVPREELADLLWPDQVPDSWPTSLSAVVSRLRRLLGEAGLDGPAALAGSAGAYHLHLPADTWVDWEVAQASIATAEAAVAKGDAARGLSAASDAAAIVEPGFLTDDCAWVDGRRDTARDIAVRAAVAKAEAQLLAGAPRRAVEEARDAVRRDPLRESGFRVLMQALAAAGERAEALRVWEHCRTTLVEELGVDPSPETEAVYLEVLNEAPSNAPAAPVTTSLPSGVVTFLLTDIVESTVLWDRQPAAMAQALERHDAAVAALVEAYGGTVLKSKLEGDATVSVFARATAGAHAALALQDALEAEAWPEGAVPRVRMALHTGEAFERAGDYFGPALNRAARLRSLADGGQVLLSQAVAELVVDHLPEGVALADRGHRDLRGLSRGENVFELVRGAAAAEAEAPAPLDRPPVPAVLVPSGPFIGRGPERDAVLTQWESASNGSPRAVLLAGEPGVGKSRLAAEVAGTAHGLGGLVLYGRCDEELGAPLQPFVEALRPLVPALGARRIRAVQGIDELSRVLPEVADLLSDPKRTSQADPDAERYALFDAITRVLTVASFEAPVLLVIDDLHWAGKTTLALLRHLLRSAEGARLLVVGTYRDTELARTHPLAATLADLHRDATAERITLGGLGADDVVAYLEAVGRHDRALGRELAQVTSGNPFFLIETLRHVEETGGTWEKGSLPQGVREATGRRLSRLSDAANDALAVAAVAGSAFSLELVETVRGAELVDEIAEACRAGLVIEESETPGRFRFAHALVRQVLLAELVTVKRVRLHRTIAELLEADGDPDANLTELAYHWFECAATGNADKAVTYCRRAADRAMERLAHEEAADLYGMALQALEGTEDDRDRADLVLARTDALLTAGEVAPARAALGDLRRAATGDARLEAWHAVFAGQLAVLAEPDRLTEIVASIGEAASAMHEQSDVAGEAKAHYVHSLALERLGQIGAAERALDAALSVARQAGDRRLADAVLACAPQAALWGPSPVARASGRCLDVVRVLRITSGTPSVEAVALRCQAVLEALRGRADAARKMIAASRRTLEELGLAHRVLESEVMAGLIELLDEEPVAAEALLRPAYEALRDRGLGGEAALAAALLGRALLQQGRDEEAEAAGEEAAELAGADLKAAITWRGVLAEAAARRGATDRAQELARAAVDLATETDALLLVADARRSLASVLRMAGDDVAAAAEAHRTAEACDAKGATALAERARAALARDPGPGAPGGISAAPPAGTARPSSLASDASPVPVDALGRGDEAIDERFRNRALRVHEDFVDAWTARDWERVQGLFAPAWHLSDRRSQGSGDLSTEESRTSLRYVFDTRRVHWAVEEVLATRGDRLVLTRRRIDIGREDEPRGEWRSLSIWRVDERGQRDLSVDFDEFDVDAAFDELDRLYIQGEGAVGSALWQRACTLVRAINSGDRDAAMSCFAPNFHFVGHGLLGWGELDAPRFVAHTMKTFDLRPDAEIRARHVLALDDRRALTVGTNSLKGDYEAVFVNLTQADGDGRIVRRDSWSLDQLDEAWERYHALGASDVPIGERFPNAATRFIRALDAAFNARDFDAFGALHGSDLSLFDRRTGGDVGAAVQLEWIRPAFEGGADLHRQSEVVATRGSRLALAGVSHHGTWGAAGETELAYLAVCEVGDIGLGVGAVFFDLDDIDSAYEELDRRFLESEGAAGRTLWEQGLAFARAADDGDDGRAAAWLAPGFTFLNHRSFGWGDLDGAGFVAHARTLHEVRGDATIRVRHVLALDEGRSLAVTSLEDEAGQREFEMPFVSVTEAAADGRAIRRDVYDLDQLDQAWARYEEIGRAHLPIEARFSNEATRGLDAMSRIWNTKDYDAFSSLFAPGFQLIDTRLRDTHMTRDEYLADIRPHFDVDGADALNLIEQTPLATRGDRLALLRTVQEGSWRRPRTGGPSDDWDTGETTLEFIRIREVDGEGRILRTTLCDLDDLDAAYEELDRRYAEMDQPPAAWDHVRRWVAAVNADDRDVAATLFAPGFRFVGHQPVGWGELDRDSYLDHVFALANLRSDVRLRVHHVLAVEGRRSIAVGTITDAGTAGEFSLEAVMVLELDGQGREVRRDAFRLDQLGEAWDRYHEIGRAEAPIGTLFPNAATRRARALVEAWNAWDFETFSSLFGPDYRFLVHRGSTADLSREEYLADIRPRFDDPDGLTRRQTPLATRGDRLALVQLRHEGAWREAGAIVFDDLLVIEVDGDGRGVRTALIGIDDLDRAYAELDRWYAEQLGDGAAARWLTEITASTGAYNRGDTGVPPEPWASAGRIHDHRLTGARTYGPDEWMAGAGALRAMAQDARVRLVHVVDARPEGTFSCLAVTGSYESGPFELGQLHVHRFRRTGPGVEHIHIYDLDGLQAARAQWAEVSGTSNQ